MKKILVISILAIVLLSVSFTSISALNPENELKLNDKIKSLEKKIKELLADNTKLKAENTKLKAENSQSKPKQILVPKPGTTWNWQLDTPVVTSHILDMYDIDLFDNDASIVKIIHSKGAKAICYISVGAWEDWRPDAKTFPSSIKGNDYDGWAGEKWLDIRKLDLLGPIIEKRLELCKQKGFDGVEPDNIDAYTNDSGFPLTYDDQLKFNIWLANKAHERGLSIGLKNDDEQVKDLIKYFDWALTEDCFVDEFCREFEPFIKNGKAVFQAEYTDTNVTTDEFCPQSKTLQFSGILKDRELDATFTSCS